jgi:hypothetical protein
MTTGTGNLLVITYGLAVVETYSDASTYLRALWRDPESIWYGWPVYRQIPPALWPYGQERDL